MSPRKPAALRDSDGVTLREHLIATAAATIGERGHRGVTVRDIAGAAGVAIGGLYNHFDDKSELLAYGLAAHVRAVHAELPPAPTPGSGTLAGNLVGFVDRAARFHQRIVPAFVGMSKQPDVLGRFDVLPAARILPGELEQYLRAEQRLGRVGAEVDTAAATVLLIGACHELVLPRLLRGDTTPIAPPAQFARDLVRTLLSGIAASG